MRESWVSSVIPPGLVRAKSVWQKFRWTNINSDSFIKVYVLKELVLFQETWSRNIVTDGEFCWKACIELEFVSSLKRRVWILDLSRETENLSPWNFLSFLAPFWSLPAAFKMAYVDSLLRIFYCLNEMSLWNHTMNNFVNISCCLRNSFLCNRTQQGALCKL